jgi:hypothetical protein
MNRTPLQRSVRESARRAGMDMDIMDAADHPADCRCLKCLKYWRMALPTLVGTAYEDYAEIMLDFYEYCPFTRAELENGQRGQND